jgi:HEAT repeat protein
VDSEQLIQGLLETENEAADDVLLEGLRRGTDEERGPILAGLFGRGTIRGLSGVVRLYSQLAEPLQQYVLKNIGKLHPTLRESGRSEDMELRMAAIHIIALGHQGKMAFVLSDNLHSIDPAVSRAACDALLDLATWVTKQTKWLQRGAFLKSSATTEPAPEGVPQDVLDAYNELQTQRPDIEATAARAFGLHRGVYGPELLRVVLLLCDWPQSRTLAILQTAKHGGQTAMIRRLQETPTAEYVDAFLIAASHGGVRGQFASVFAHLNDPLVLDALLQKTHWLKDAQLQLCAHQVTHGAWWSDRQLSDDVARRDPEYAARIGDWLAVSGAHDVVQDDRMERLRTRAVNSLPARVRLFRLAAGRRRGTSIMLIKEFLADPDERLCRMAARELIRRGPPDYENLLIQRLPSALPTVRRVINRHLGRVSFEQFWERFTNLEISTRRQAGRAMIKILPEFTSRLAKRLHGGSIEQRLRAMQIAEDLNLVPELRQEIIPLTQHSNPKVRSKAATILSGETSPQNQRVLIQMLGDTDPRVRANVIDALGTTNSPSLVALIAERAKTGHHRERANSIKALHRMRMESAAECLVNMLTDQRPEHRVSALWALKQIGLWKLLGEVGRLAKEDDNLRVRRYAMDVLKNLNDMSKTGKEKSA